MAAAADLLAGAFTMDRALGALELARERKIKLTEGDFFTLCCQVGRMSGPYLLKHAWGLRVIPPSVVTESIAHVWSMTDFPHQQLVHADWRRLFLVAGFTIDGKAAGRPDRPVRLYRGCVRGHQRRFSWSAKQEVAEWFAARFSENLGISPCYRAAFVYETEAPPESLLCIPGSAGREDESEYVIDPRGLVIRETGQ